MVYNYSQVLAQSSTLSTDHFKPQADFAHALRVGNEKLDAVLLGGQVDVRLRLAP